MPDKIVMLDGYSLMYRAFHALQTPMTAPDGTPTNAVHGFIMMLLKVLDEEKPAGIAVAFDMHAPTLRAQEYAEYKGTRKPMPDELRAQDPVIRQLIGLMGIPILEKEGYEADDILGTVSAKCEREGREIVLVTGDRDSFQLSGEKTTILYTKRGISDTVRVTPEYIFETYGLKPIQMIDVKGLMGDASDNIPGVPGVGEKTALKLIQQYGSLENVLNTAETEQKGKLRERLIEHRDLAELSKHLATIDRAVPIEIDFESWRPDGLGGGVALLKELGMNQAARKLTEKAQAIAPASVPVAREKVALPAIERLDSIEAFSARVKEMAKTAQWASAYYGIELTAATESARLSLPIGGDLFSAGVTEDEAEQALLPLLEADCPKSLYNVKTMRTESMCGQIADVMLAAYALNPQRESFSAEALCQAEGIEDFAAHPAQAIHELSEIQARQLKETGLERIYSEIELPLSNVLRDMEHAGFLVDADALETLGKMFRKRIGELTDEIGAMAGVQINLNSPKQLGELLFEKLGIRPPKKTARGYSTSAEVLEQLADEHPICARILEYRKYQKLESTYIHSLLELRDGEGRIHTRFDQVATATGRISSAEPNLQNIPVRTELGREIRRAFIASPGCKLVDADYSQIELRVLAHMSGDETMISAFREGQDIHARTAAEVYGVPLDQVTHEMRSRSKAVNFGIVYGISDFTLAKNISVSRKEAREFIDRYFERYPGVKKYMDEAVKTGKEKGYVETLMGRRRYLPELSSANFNVRAFGERCAMNSPIQGTAADIIKLAMIAVARRIQAENLRARLILQVHDELIVEAPEDEVDRVKALLKDCMEGVVALKVPLRADISTGGDWRECK